VAECDWRRMASSWPRGDARNVSKPAAMPTGPRVGFRRCHDVVGGHGESVRSFDPSTDRRGLRRRLRALLTGSASSHPRRPAPSPLPDIPFWRPPLQRSHNFSGHVPLFRTCALHTNLRAALPLLEGAVRSPCWPLDVRVRGPGHMRRTGRDATSAAVSRVHAQARATVSLLGRRRRFLLRTGQECVGAAGTCAWGATRAAVIRNANSASKRGRRRRFLLTA
jgi:hypothetical protein